MKRAWLVGGALIAVVAACGPAPAGTPDASPSLAASTAVESTVAAASASPDEPPPASASAPATPPETPLATATAPGAGDLARDSLIEILVSDLVVRSDPGVDPPSTILASRMRAPDRALVVDGPVPASGYDWYLVAPLDRADGTRGPFGWIARASREGEAWVRSIEPPCPVATDLADVLGLQPLERLACYGGEALTLTAPSLTCGAGGGPWIWDPAWLMVIGGCALAIDESLSLLMRVPPGVTGPGGSTPVTVTGHFDDPAAAGCTVTTTDPADPAPGPEEAVVICRTQFVIEP